ncbi:hypothetical protein TSMEX_004586 [Taenia solium]
MTLSNLGAAAATSSDIPQSAQHQLSTVIQNVIKSFQKVLLTSSKEDSVAVGNMILSSVFDVLAGTQSQLVSPHSEDVVTEPSEMRYDSNIDNVGMSNREQLVTHFSSKKPVNGVKTTLDRIWNACSRRDGGMEPCSHGRVSLLSCVYQ